MKIISIGTDRKLFILNSEVGERQKLYGEKIERTEIIVFSWRALGLKVSSLSPKVRVIPTNSLNHWFYIFDAIKIGRRLVRPDLITAQDPFECGLVGLALSRYFRAKLELQVHTDFLSPHFAGGVSLNRLRVIIARRLLPRADKIRVVSNRIKLSLVGKLKIAEDKITVRPIAVDLEKIKRMPVTVDLQKRYPQFSKIILMASRLTKEKNMDLAIEAMRNIVKKVSHLGLIIVGSGPEEPRLKLKVINYGLEANVIFEPWVEFDTLISYYKTADLFLLTSLYEGYGLTLVEAQAAGCTIISTDVGVAREAGSKIISYNPIDVSDAIIESLK